MIASSRIHRTLSVEELEPRIAPARIFVDIDATGGGTGVDWTNAYTNLQLALADAAGNADPNDEVWVADGTYTPDGASPGDRTLSFQLLSGVDIYGGFAGGESLLSERDWTTNVATLSGDIGTPGDNADNSYHAVRGSNGAILDGFTITAGNANGGGEGNNGAGMYNSSASPTVTNCIFTGNSAATYSGAMHNANSSPIITDTVFAQNTSIDCGGAMLNSPSASPTITGCVFIGNVSDGSGGAIYSSNSSSPTLTNCVFADNVADLYGGGVASWQNCNPTFMNCTFSGNYARLGGGAVYNSTATTATITNCILWGDTTGNEIRNYDGATAAISFCDIRGCGGSGAGWNTALGTDGGANIDAKPLFVNPSDPAGPDGIFATTDDGLRLYGRSPAIDAGTGVGAPAVDIMGTTRPLDSSHDLGAYECLATGPGVIYVDIDAAGSNMGTSWADAYTDIQLALAIAQSGDEIWVADGTYKPDSALPGDRTLSFQLLSGVALYGGFAGGESLLSERDWSTNVAILSGDIGTPGDNADNSYHVLRGVDNAALDGFTITGGYAAGSVAADKRGGGIYNSSDSPTLANCLFTGNYAELYGGGMYNNNSDPVVANCTFSLNTSGDAAGAVFNSSSSTPTFTDCAFVGNTATGSGGAIYNSISSSPTLTNCVFADNAADLYGGGVASWQNCNPTFINCTFTGNYARLGGGAVYNSTATTATITNCILWGDSTGKEIRNYDGGTAIVSFSNIQNSNGSGGSWDIALGTDAGGNIDNDPLFVNASDPDGTDDILGTADDGLRLQNGSLCVDTATAVGAPGTDILGIVRPQKGGFDMGAYENDNDLPTLSGVAAAVSFGENTVNAAAQVIDSDVTFDDPDGGDLGDGRLTVTYSIGGGAEDQLSIWNEGTGAGMIGVSGSTVSYEGVAFGTITSDGANGADLIVIFDTNSSVAAIDALIEHLTYANTSDSPTASRTISITIDDGDGGTSTPQTCAITVVAENDAPIATDDGGVGYTADEDTPFTTANILANDSDPDTSDTLSVSSIDTTGTIGLVTDNGDGTFDYDPNGLFEYLAVGESTTDTFAYTVTDGNGGFDAATVTITINGVNDAPMANDNAAATDEDTVLNVAAPGVLANDTDTDTTDVLGVASYDATSTQGASVVVNADGSYSYDPRAAAALQALADGESVMDTFTYTVSDGNGGFDTATVSITITGVSDAPIIALLADSPDPVYRPFPLALTASGVSDAEGTVTAVEFYVDENANNTVDVGIDTLLGTGTNAGGGVWTWSDYTYGWAFGTYTYLARAQDDQGAWSADAVATGDVAEIPTVEVVPGQVILYDTDLGEAPDISAADVIVKLDTKDGSVKSVTIVGNPTGLGILVNSIGAKAITIKDARKTKTFPILEEISFVACMGPANQISLNSPVTAWGVGPVLQNEGLIADADLDGDGDTDDLMAIYCGAPTKTVKVLGQVGGDVVVAGADAKFVGLGKLDVKNGNVVGEVVTTDGGLKGFSIKGGDLFGNVIVSGDLGKLSVKAGKDALGLPVGGTIDGVDILVTGLAKGIAANAITGSLIAAMNIGSVSVKTNLTDSRIHAGGIVDRDHNWVTQAHGNIKGVSVKGNMTDCDITAGVWLGADGVWGTDDTVVDPDPLLTSIISKVNVTGSITWTQKRGILAATDVASVQAKADELSVKSENLPYVSPDGNLRIDAGGGW